MKVILAVDLKPLEKFISERKDIDVLKNVRSRKTLLDDCLSLNPHLVIISRSLPGEGSIREILATLKVSRDEGEFKGRIIYLYGEDDVFRKSFTNFLIDVGVYDFHIGDIDEETILKLIYEPKGSNEVIYEDIQEATHQDDNEILEEIEKEEASGITEPQIKIKFVERIVEVEKVVKVKEIVEVEKRIERTIKQNVLAFYTTDNSLDKDDVLTQISILLAKKSNQKILVIDMNTLTPSLDHFFAVDKEIEFKDIYNITGLNTGLAAVYNAIEKNIFRAELLEDFTIQHKKYSNLSILTGFYDVNLFESAEIKHFEELIDKAKEVYDTVIINTNNCISIDATYAAFKKASTIIGVSNANFTNARNLNFIFKYLIDYHRIPEKKFKIIVNNLSRYSLTKDVMAEIFKRFEVLGYIPFNPVRQKYLNEKKCFITSHAASKDILSYLEIIEKLGYIPKTSMFDKLFNKKKIEGEICSSTVKDGEEICPL